MKENDKKPIVIYCIKQFGTTQQPVGDTIGFFTDLDDAKECVTKNSGDMAEGGYYPYAVIFPVQEGLYNFPSPEVERWYVWIKSENAYIQTSRPDFMEGWALSI